MDKFDEAAEAFIAEAPPEEQEQARKVLTVAADTLRTFEQLASDIDRIASALEKIADRPA